VRTTDRQISVVVPTYNGGPTLDDALESIRRQTFQPVEVVVVDDGSTDDSAARAERHAVRARVIRLEGNHGVAFARNVGLQAATGELVAFIDQDDLWVPHRLERVSQAFRENPDWQVVVTDESVFASEEDRAQLELMSHDFLPWVEHWVPAGTALSLLDVECGGSAPLTADRVSQQQILRGSITVTTSYVLSRTLALSCGGFAGWLRSADDWILLQTMSQYTEIWRIGDATVLYRVHPTNTSTTTDWPMPLMVAAAALRLGGRVVPRGAERDPDVVGKLSSAPFLTHLLGARAQERGWRAGADAWAAWQLLSTDRSDRWTTGRVLARALAVKAVPVSFRAQLRRLRRSTRG
jgi:glycosyltransferase involved in cell wall biosynthesis